HALLDLAFRRVGSSPERRPLGGGQLWDLGEKSRNLPLLAAEKPPLQPLELLARGHTSSGLPRKLRKNSGDWIFRADLSHSCQVLGGFPPRAGGGGRAGHTRRLSPSSSARYVHAGGRPRTERRRPRSRRRDATCGGRHRRTRPPQTTSRAIK